jgi:DNA-binding response OmpR family regulator
MQAICKLTWRQEPLKKSNELLKLTSTEFNLISLFARHEGCVLTHRFILKEIWGEGYQTEIQYLRVFVGSLRKKIEEIQIIPCTSLRKAVWATAFNSLYKIFIYSAVFLSFVYKVRRYFAMSC